MHTNLFNQESVEKARLTSSESTIDSTIELLKRWKVDTYTHELYIYCLAYEQCIAYKLDPELAFKKCGENNLIANLCVYTEMSDTLTTK